MTQDEQRFLMGQVADRLSCARAAIICEGLVKQINRTGGERQRSEGVKWLNRVAKRCREMAALPIQPYKN